MAGVTNEGRSPHVPGGLVRHGGHIVQWVAALVAKSPRRGLILCHDVT